MQATIVEGVLDLEKFFDTVDIQKLSHQALELGYPVVPLSLGVMVHTAVRVLTTPIGVSDPLTPPMSILQGCGQSVP